MNKAKLLRDIYCILGGMTLSSLVIFLLVAGILHESNKWILLSEIILIASIVLAGFGSLQDIIRGGKR